MLKQFTGNLQFECVDHFVGLALKVLSSCSKVFHFNVLIFFREFRQKKLFAVKQVYCIYILAKDKTLVAVIDITILFHFLANL